MPREMSLKTKIKKTLESFPSEYHPFKSGGFWVTNNVRFKDMGSAVSYAYKAYERAQKLVSADKIHTSLLPHKMADGEWFSCGDIFTSHKSAMENSVREYRKRKNKKTNAEKDFDDDVIDSFIAEKAPRLVTISVPTKVEVNVNDIIDHLLVEHGIKTIKIIYDRAVFSGRTRVVSQLKPFINSLIRLGVI